MGRSGVDRASSSDAWGPGLNLCHSASKNTTSLPRNTRGTIRGRVQLRILELGDEAGEKQKKNVVPNLLRSKSEKHFGYRPLTIWLLKPIMMLRWLVRPPTHVTSLLLNRVLTIHNFLLGWLLPFLLARYIFFFFCVPNFLPFPLNPNMGIFLNRKSRKSISMAEHRNLTTPKNRPQIIVHFTLSRICKSCDYFTNKLL